MWSVRWLFFTQAEELINIQLSAILFLLTWGYYFGAWTQVKSATEPRWGEHWPLCHSWCPQRAFCKCGVLGSSDRGTARSGLRLAPSCRLDEMHHTSEFSPVSALSSEDPSFVCPQSWRRHSCWRLSHPCLPTFCNP